MLSPLTLRLNAALSRRNIKEPRLSSRAKVVVVLIPPPVDPGEAPMNISSIAKSKPAWEKEEISTVLKPAVLVVTL